VLLIRQYRHPVGRYLWELPAGLLDVPDEPASQAAARELAEEAGLRASEWHVLVDGLTSPGMTDEAIRVFLARGIAPVADDERFEGEHEEAELHAAWVPLDDVLDAALRGEIENVMCLLGVFTVAEARRRGYAGLRSVDVDWPTRPRASG
jgi:ADP-ribose pyrophosphatase